jgi:hypothetical protein
VQKQAKQREQKKQPFDRDRAQAEIDAARKWARVPSKR